MREARRHLQTALPEMDTQVFQGLRGSGQLVLQKEGEREEEEDDDDEDLEDIKRRRRKKQERRDSKASENEDSLLFPHLVACIWGYKIHMLRLELPVRRKIKIT